MLDVIFPFAGGLGLFLFGMMLLSEGLVAFAGGTLQRVLVTFTGTPYKAFLSGALLTALVQSSTATTVTLIGFVSAGLLTFIQAIGVVIGASLGNTATGWIVATLGLKIKLGFYTLPLIGVGALLKLLTSGKISELGRAIAGFGMLFLGLSMLQEGMQGLSSMFSLAHLPSGSYGAHVIILLIGLALTAVLQSSTAAIAMTLTALHSGTINFDQAAAMAIGASIGTTLTGALVAIGGTIYAKRTALAYILFNAITGLIALIFLPVFLAATHWLTQHLGFDPGAISLAAFHSLFIATGAVIFLPLTQRFAALVDRLIPEKETRIHHHLDASLLTMPAVALEASQRDLEALALQLFQLYQSMLDQTPPANAKEVLRQTQTVLNAAYDFIARIQPPQRETALNAQRNAQLHVVDHLLRLRARIDHLLGNEQTLKDSTFDWAVTQTRQMLELARAQLTEAPDPERIEKIAETASGLNLLLKEVRRDILTGQAASSHASVTLRTTDTYRWLERSSNHIWRICHHLHLGRSAEHHPDEAAYTLTRSGEIHEELSSNEP